MTVKYIFSTRDYKLQFLYVLMIVCSEVVYWPFSEKFKSDLLKIAMTTLSSKILSQDKEHFAKLAVDAVMRLKVNVHS